MIDFSVEGHVALITINRPEARNAVNGAVASGIEAAIDRLEGDDELWVGVLTGAGPAFCAGADLKAISAGQGAALSTARGGFGGFTSRERTKPVIAACEGPALAGGTEIVLACDMVVASTAASFGLPEVKRSLVAGAGGLFRLPKALPPAIAMEAVLTGDPLTAERAAHFGLVNELAEPGQAVAAAMRLAARISVNAPLAVRASRSVVRAALRGDEEAMWTASAEATARVAVTEDFKEGPLAFIEKRPPVWKGR